MSHQEGHALDWDSEINNDGEEFILIPDGEYTFTVKEVSRKDYPGSNKIPACKKIEIKMEITSPVGTATVKDDLILWSTMEWKMAAFFVSLGMREKGQKGFRPDWNAVIGRSGLCKTNIREYTKKDGSQGQANNIDRFLPPDTNVGSAVAQPQTQQPIPSAAQPSQGWQGGNAF